MTDFALSHSDMVEETDGKQLNVFMLAFSAENGEAIRNKFATRLTDCYKPIATEDLTDICAITIQNASKNNISVGIDYGSGDFPPFWVVKGAKFHGSNTEDIQEFAESAIKAWINS